MKRRMIALAMALVMCLSLVPTVAFAGEHDGQVRVIVENTTYAKSAGAPWEGTLVDEWIDLASNSTMMSCVEDALTAKGYTQTGAENNYISEINGLAEQAGSYNMSGWMGTLNDWFTNKGFGAFTVANDNLFAGDEIRIMYTLNGGADIGSNKSNNDKTVKSVIFSDGTLDTTFASDTNAYTLTVPAGTESITVTPTASNKNYQVRTFVDETEYKRTAAIPVTDGTVITVKCGDPEWPSMNGSAGEAQTYTFKVAYEQSVEPEPVFDPASLMYSDFRLYPSVAAYQADPGSYYPLTPAYDPNREDQLHYSVTLPDYQTSVFGYRTLDGMEGYLNTQQVTYQGYTFDVFSSSSGMLGAGWQGGANGVTNNCFISKPTFGDSYMYLDDYLSATIDGQSTKLANVRVKGIRSASLKSLAIDGVWVDAFAKENANCSIFVDPDSDGIDIKATGYRSNYTVTIGETTANSGTAIHVAYVWDENGKMVLPITVTPPETVDGYPAIPSTYTVTLKQMPKADKPAFMTQPVGGNRVLSANGKTNITMSVVASANGAMSYQWFKAEDAEGANAVAVDGATTASYKFSLTAAEDAYYFCRVTNTASTQSADSAAVLVKVYPDPTPEVCFAKKVPALTVTEYNGTALPKSHGYFYYVGDQASPIEVEYNCPVPEATVQIFCDQGTVKMLGNGKATVTPKTDFAMAKSSGTNGIDMFIYAVATLEGKEYVGYTDEDIWLFVAAKDTDVPAPVLKTQPVGAVLDQNARRSISVAADTATTVGVKYQWYVNTENSYEGAVPVASSGTSKSYTLPTSESGTRYYFCKVTNNLQGFTKSTNSDIAEIKVRGEVPIPFTGAGTEADPYTISTVDELKELKRLVNVEGADFTDKFVKLTADLTLTNESWTSSIGCTIDGTHNIQNGNNLRAFPGTFDGDNHTLTFDGTGTVKPLFGYVRNTTIKNLNIQGTENVVFEDHGLISTVEGVGLGGTAAIIDHVTLKSGTKTTKSGLVGGNLSTNAFAAASATFKTTITNCVVEEGCIIGVNGDQNMIGGIAGRLICEIDNCEVSATVKGKNFVGGILGTIDNALGVGDVSNSAFHGEVISTGWNAGGVVGGGYENGTAPNGFRSNLVDNTVDGTVKGVKNVGGIFGGDEYVAQSWNNSASRITGNTFTGKVEGTENVGAIIGFYDSLNKFNDVSGNLYAADCGADKGIGAVRYIDTNYANPTPAAGTTYFSTEFSTADCPVVGSCNWKTAHNRTDDPLGADADKLCKVISAPEHTVTVSVGPKTVNAFFYTDAAATVPVAADKVVDNGVKGNYHVYTVTLPEGECSYRGEETVSGVVQPIGGEQFTVGTEDFSMNLVRANFYVNSNAMTHEDDWTLTGLTNESTGKEVVLGAKYPNGTNKIMYQAALLRCGAAYSGSTLTVNENLLEDYYVKAQLAKFTVGATAYSVQNKTLSISAYNRFTLVVPADAEKVEFFEQTANFVVKAMNPAEMTTTDNGDGTTTYQFKSQSTNYGSQHTWRVSKTGKTTLAGYMKNGNAITVTWPEQVPATTANAPVSSAFNYDDNSVLLNIDDSKDTNELAMQVGETFKLRAFRNGWEIISDVSGNKMIEPDFHYSILSGNDVISVAPVTDQLTGNAKDNWMNITALNEGTAVVAVWYDAIHISGSSGYDGFYGATNPARYGYVVVNVGADSTVAIIPVSADGDWDAEFDTVYYVGDEGGTFSFTSDDATSVTVTNLCGATMGSAKTVTKTDDKWNVPVYNGSNLITITSASGTDYRLVRAKKVNAIITNITTGKKSTDEGFAITVGDTVSVSLDKLDMPLPKMSGIYNPGVGGTCKMVYQIDGKYTQVSKGTQYDFPTPALCTVTFVASQAGDIHLGNGYITTGVFGSAPGAHRGLTDAGKPVNTNAPEASYCFGKLPELTLHVEDGALNYADLTELSSFNLHVGMFNGMSTAKYVEFKTAADAVGVWESTPNTNAYLSITVTPKTYYNTMKLTYRYDGQSATMVNVPANNELRIPVGDQWSVHPDKILNLVFTITPGDGNTDEAKSYTFVVMSKQDKTALEKVILAIKKIGKVTLESNNKIADARTAYDALKNELKEKVTNYSALTAAEAAYANIVRTKANDIYTAVGNSLLANAEESTPTVGSTGGEWLMLGLARSGRSVPAGYYDNVVQYVKANVNDNERLHNSKSTDNSRVILALTAIGKDPTKVGGHDLTRGLNSMSYLNKQGTNGPVWALIALDSHNYAVSGDDVTREKLIDTICRAQMESGGWYISDADHPVEDVDMTAMAVQALAPYYKKNNADAKSAVDKALAWLASEQGKDGDFGSSESDAQVIVALCALGIDPASDSHFIKGGSSVLSAMCSYYADGAKGFKHTKNGDYDQMATEQCYYALVAYDRFVNGETALYDMSDVHQMTKTAAKAATCTAEGNNEYYTCSACKKVFTDADGKTETTVAAETLTKLGHAMTKTDAKAATCTADGNNEYWTCSVCKQVFKDKAGATETTLAAETLTKLGHDFTKKVVNDAHLKTSATCKSAAIYYYECSRCSNVSTTDTFASGSTTPHTYGTDGKCACGAENPMKDVKTGNIAPATEVGGKTVAVEEGKQIVADDSGLAVKTDSSVALNDVKDAVAAGSTVVKIDENVNKTITATEADKTGIEALKKLASDTNITGEQKYELDEIVAQLVSYNTNAAKPNVKVEQVVDVSLELVKASDTNVTLGEIKELAQPIEIRIPVTSNSLKNAFANPNKVVKAIISHTGVNGIVTTIEADVTFEDGKAVILMDAFSTVAFVTYDKAPDTNGGSSSYKPADTRTFTTDLAAGSINAVFVDGKKLDSKYYTISGSTVTLTEAFMATLKAGKHTIRIENATRMATATFNVAANGVMSARTGDAGVVLYIAMGAMSYIGSAAWIRKRKDEM